MRCKDQISLKLSLMLLTVCCFGCSGGGTDVDLGTVSGVVTMDDKPLANAVVVFMPEKGNSSTGRTDANGYYELAYLGDAKGAIPGKNKVSITTGKAVTVEVDADTDMSSLESATELVEEADTTTQEQKPAKKDPIPAKYNTETTLTADVKNGSNTFDFKLESK